MHGQTSHMLYVPLKYGPIIGDICEQHLNMSHMLKNT